MTDLNKYFMGKSMEIKKDEISNFNVEYMLTTIDSVFIFLELAFKTCDLAYISHALKIADRAIKKIEAKVQEIFPIKK